MPLSQRSMREFTTWKMRLSKGAAITSSVREWNRVLLRLKVHCKAAAVPGGAAHDGAVCAGLRMSIASGASCSSTEAPLAWVSQVVLCLS